MDIAELNRGEGVARVELPRTTASGPAAPDQQAETNRESTQDRFFGFFRFLSG